MTWDLHTLFRRHSREIARALRRSGLRPETAADLTQDAFLRLLATGSADAAATVNPRAYLYRIARNLRIDHARRARLMPVTELSDEAFAALPDTAPTPETIVYDRQRLAITEAALNELPERTRRAFELHRVGGRTIAAVAEELDLSTTRTWALIREAYHHVRTRLHEAVD